MKDVELPGKTAAAVLALILILAAGTRLWKLDAPSLWEDDYLNLDRGLMPLASMWQVQKWQGPADTPFDFQPPLSFALLHAVLDESRSVVPARLVSVAAGLAAILGTFVLGRRLFGPGPGLIAALLLTLSLFHLEYSRAIKAYGLFFALGVWSAVFIHRAVERGRALDFVAWGVTAAAMMYSAYIGLPAFAGQAVWAGCVIVSRAFAGERGQSRKLTGLVAASLAAGAAYVPWLPAVFFLRGMFDDPGVNPLARLTPQFFSETLAGYFTSAFPAPQWFIPALTALAAAGTLYILLTGRVSALMLLALWTGPPTMTVLLSRSVMNEILSSRHLFTLLAPAVLLPACGAWGLAWFALGGRKGQGVEGTLGLSRPADDSGNGLALLCALAISVALCWPALSRLPEAASRSISLDRDFFYWLWAKAPQESALAMEGWKRKSKAFGAGWYLPGLYASPGDFGSRGHRSVLYVENRAGGEPAIAPPGAIILGDDRYGPFRTRTSLLPVAPRGPLPVIPDENGRFVYEDDFSSPGMLADAWTAANAAPDLTLGMLGPVRASKPAEAVYRFKAQPGTRMERASLTLSAVLYKANPARAADSVLEVLAGPEPDRLAVVERLEGGAFAGPDGRTVLGPCPAYEEQRMYQTCARKQASFELTAHPPGGDLWVVIRITPGVSEGLLLVDSLRLETVSSGVAEPDATPFAMELDALCANVNVQPWTPGAAAREAVFAFASKEGLAGPGRPVEPPAAHEAFLAANPGIKPIRVLTDSAGEAGVSFYSPGLTLAGEKASATLINGKAAKPEGLVLSGRLLAPSLAIGGERLDIPVAAPAGSVLMLNPGGQGRLVWSPDFSRAGFNPAAGFGDLSSREDVRPCPDADNDGGLTCRDGKPCSFTARFVSGLPMNRIRLEWYPRVVADPEGKNGVRLSYSTDEGKTFVPIESFTGGKSGRWTPMFSKRARELVFSKPVSHFLLKAELTGEAAQIWSHKRAVDRMWLEFSLDARSVRPVSLPEGSLPVTMAGPEGSGDAPSDFAIHFSDRPVPFYDALKDWR